MNRGDTQSQFTNDIAKYPLDSPLLPALYHSFSTIIKALTFIYCGNLSFQ